ncbi:MAG: hypothetical protein EA379_04005 [Phycisphaerales bacterium]|nr:MAG: hypothetical protein EA379_04005 [Phycisphaerales bacterium]
MTPILASFAILLLLAIGPVLFTMLTGLSLVRTHERSLDRREGGLTGIRLDNRKAPDDPSAIMDSALVVGHVVLAADPLSVVRTRLRLVVGGEARSMGRLIRRARREALIRLREDAIAKGAAEVWNVRFETSSISRRGKRPKAMQIEMLVTGTAVVRAG